MGRPDQTTSADSPAVDERKRRSRLLQRVALGLAAVAGFSAIGLLIFGFVRFGTFKAVSGSMEPTLLPDDHFLVDHWHYRSREPKRGDVVVIEQPETGNSVVTRVLATGGESISIVDKQMHIDGEPLDDPWAVNRDQRTFRLADVHSPLVMKRDQLTPFVLSDGHVFLMGDNRDYSYDSRFFGPIPEEKIRGRVLIVYWPPTERLGVLPWLVSSPRR